MVATVVTCGGLCPGLNAVWGPGMVRGMSAGPIERYPNPLILERRTNYSKTIYIYIIINFTYIYIYIFVRHTQSHTHTHTHTHTHIYIYIYINTCHAYVYAERKIEKVTCLCVSQAKDLKCNGNSSAIFIVFKKLRIFPLVQGDSRAGDDAGTVWCCDLTVAKLLSIDSCHPVAPRLTFLRSRRSMESAGVTKESLGGKPKIKRMRKVGENDKYR